jgi:CubicO group peptidase (beta-lactamase class C family)
MPINFQAWHDQTATQHQEKANKFLKQGFRTISLCVYGETNDPRYAAVMVKRSNPAEEKPFIALSMTEMQKKTDDLQKQGFGAAIISATGPADNPLIAAIFRPMKPLPVTKGALTADALVKANQQAWNEGRILRWADAYGTPNDTRYMAVWQPNTDMAAWNCDAIKDDAKTMQQRFDALISGGGRPQHLALTPAQGFLGVFVDTDIGAWSALGDMTSAGFQAQKEKLEKQGFAPVCVAAQGSGAKARFAAIFTTREEIAPRVFSLSDDTPSIKAIDDIIEGVMKKNRVRGAAVAVVKGTRLVYAKGYTWAEAGYPKVKPTTLFRQASVSKVFASIATYQLIQEQKLVDGKKFTLDTTMQSVLKLKTPTGGEPIDPNFGKITIRHLLEMTSGIDKDLVFRDVQAVAAFKPPKSLPAKTEHLASFCASQSLSGKPGDKSIANYNNGGYMMLGQVIAKMRGAKSFEEAIKTSLLQPLGIKRVRETRSLVSAQLKDEAHYHATEECVAFSNGSCTNRLFPRIRTSISVMTPDQQMVPLGYGDTNLENVDGAGGLSGAVTDVARVVAALSLRKNNPMLDDKTITTMLANAAAATADDKLTKNSKGKTKSWGFHGFDRVFALDAAKGIYLGIKGGSYWTSVNIIGFFRGGMAYVVCWNCTTPLETDDTWLQKFWTEINKEVHNQKWGNTDLFPQFGMPSFPASPGFFDEAKPDVKVPPMPKFKIGSIAPTPEVK